MEPLGVIQAKLPEPVLSDMDLQAGGKENA